MESSASITAEQWVESVTEEQMGEWRKLLNEDALDMVEVFDRGRLVQSLPFGVEGFGHLYWCVMKRELPPYAKNVWIPALVKAWDGKTGVILEGFRGATKSTILFCWVLYVQGKRPVGNSILVRINDQAAAETGNAMAEIIEKSAAWKACFPNVVPDKERKWSTEGWFIKDAGVDYTKWIQQTIADHGGEASILTAGITSGVHIGKHPSNGWYADDFHDEQNTRSEREMSNIVTTIEKNIIPTWTRPSGHPTLAVACTFWNDADGYHSLLKTGLFEHVKTPIYSLDTGSAIVYPGITNNGARIRLAWPEAYPVEKICEIERQNPVWFPVMYLCNLESLKGTVLRREWLHVYPADKIGENWPAYFGIDFASSDDKRGDRERDYFAMAVGKAIPGGGMVIVDGIRGKWPASESLAHIKAFAAKYPSLANIGVEKWGKGETFKDFLLYSSDLPVVPCPVQGTPVKSKGQRYQTEGGLAPMFVDGRLWLTSEQNDFFKAFEEEWISWDGQRTRTGHDDCLDAVYWTAYMGQGNLLPKSEQNRIGVAKERKHNPWNSLGKRS